MQWRRSFNTLLDGTGRLKKRFRTRSLLMAFGTGCLLVALLLTAFPTLFHQQQHAAKAAGGITDQGLIGWEADLDGPATHMDGSFDIQAGKNFTVSFGIYGSNNYPVQWSNSEGYLPCDVSQFEVGNSTVKIMNFGDKVTINGNDYVAVYSRVSVYNHDTSAVTLDPAPSSSALLPLNSVDNTVNPGQTANHDYVIAVDKFNNSYDWPADSDLVAQGGWDQHYAHMKNYWNNRLAALVQINQLPDQRMADSFKASYIYAKITEDPGGTADSIHPGENGYKDYYDHDALGIVLYYISIGDYTNAQSYLTTLHSSGYDDFYYKYPWVWATYLMKTGDTALVNNNFSAIHDNTHQIETKRTGPNGTMEYSWTIDAWGYWTTDNEAALLGLASYMYITQQIGNTSEYTWAQNLYNSLLSSVNAEMTTTIQNSGQNYIPCAVDVDNSQNRCKDAQDSNNVSFWALGRFGWEGYLFDAQQSGPMIDLIDATFDHVYGRLQGVLPPHDMGGFPGYSEVYQVGAASEGLRGNGPYRPEAIRVYQFMIDDNMDGPYSWWESNGTGPVSTPWIGNHPTDGLGAAPHIWGAAQMNEALLNSLIAQRSDGSVLVGRGVPQEWIAPGQVIDVSNYPIANNHRMGIHVVTGSDGKTVTLTTSGDTPSGTIVFDLPGFKNNIVSTTSGTIDNNEGSVTFSSSVTSVTVTLASQPSSGGSATPTPTATSTPSATPTPTPGLPAPWQSQDIGSVGSAGSVSYNNGTFSVAGSGDDIWNNADAFHYVYQPLSGDGSIVARVASQQNTDGWAKAGVMIRQSLDAGSPHAFMAITPGAGAAFQDRAVSGGSSSNTNSGSWTAPSWVKLVRSGNTFTGSVSSDGSNWTQIGSTTVTMNSSVYVGLAVTSHNNGTLSTATFDNVSVGGGATPTPTPTPTATPSPTPTPTPTQGSLVVAINAGGASAGSFVADTDYDTGNQYSDTSSSIDTSGVSNPAPQAVYQTCRWNSSFTYTIPNLTAGKSYKVRLHWAELSFQASGLRTFNVAINGASVLSNFDVYATAGYKHALVKEFTATANSSGQIVIVFSQGIADNPFVSGIEVYTT